MATTDADAFDVDIQRVGQQDKQVVRLATGLPGRVQTATLGSHAVVPLDGRVRIPAELTAVVIAFPTVLEMARMISWGSFALGIDRRGFPFVCTRDESLTALEPLSLRQWQVVGCGVHQSGEAWVGHRPLHHEGLFVQTGRLRSTFAEGPQILIGAGFDGKLEQPALWGRAFEPHEVLVWDRVVPSEDIIADWNLGGDPSTARFEDQGPAHLDGRVVGAPTRAVTGHHWTGNFLDRRAAPSEYEAVHFHTDDLEDSGFKADTSWLVPADTPSGLYVAELSASGGGKDRLPIVVRPTRVSADRALVLLPTFTYLAYANERLGREMATNRPPDWNPPRDDRDEWLAGHPELGRSLYDEHRDGSGVGHSTSLRPIPNMRDDYHTEMVNGPRHLAADRLLLTWLDGLGIPWDVVCDHDLDREGSSLLEGVRLVITGSHPEYTSRRLREALERHVATGGRIAYLGGNGFYWVAAIYPNRPHLLEVRRGNAGTRAWESAPGEAHLAATGEPGGIWRHRGRPPNALVGVGFTAQGWDGKAVAYRRCSGSSDPRAAFVFEGVNATRIGASGLAMGGAAGDELDRADPRLGTPHDALILARSEPLSDAYQPVIEDHPEITQGLGGPSNPDVRADMVLLLGTNGSAVFSTGSICWIASLPVDAAASRITENVVRAFLKEGLPA